MEGLDYVVDLDCLENSGANEQSGVVVVNEVEDLDPRAAFELRANSMLPPV
jgi:hypothetical protein